MKMKPWCRSEGSIFSPAHRNECIMSAATVGSPGTTSKQSALTRFSSNAARLRVALVLGCGVAVALAFWIGTPAPYLESDIELARLLRGMAVIKAFIVLAGVGLLLWRFGRPVSRHMAGVYLAGAWLAAGASMLIWQLTLIPLAALTFHAGELALLVAAWRDRNGEWRRSFRSPIVSPEHQ
jgi:hypothetical protein